jgi:hypothetical protein
MVDEVLPPELLEDEPLLLPEDDPELLPEDEPLLLPDEEPELPPLELPWCVPASCVVPVVPVDPSPLGGSICVDASSPSPVTMNEPSSPLPPSPSVVPLEPLEPFEPMRIPELLPVPSGLRDVPTPPSDETVH